MGDNDKYRHLILEHFISRLKDYQFDYELGFPLTNFTFADTDKKRVKAMRYLLHREYFSDFYKNDVLFVKITKKGAEAYFTEYFLEEYKKGRFALIEKRVMIWCNIVVALGVLFTLVFTLFFDKPKELEKLQWQVQTISLMQKKDSALHQIQITPVQQDSSHH